MSEPRLRASAEVSEKQLVALLRAHAIAPPSIDDPHFADNFERFADARALLIGEASHGTSEFHRAHAAIIRRLIERQSHYFPGDPGRAIRCAALAGTDHDGYANGPRHIDETTVPDTYPFGE